VSRTRLAPARYHDETITVFRAVLANPLTTEDILVSVLEEQCEWARHPEISPLLDRLQEMTAAA
jgi:glutamate decarboxylase